MTKKMKKEEGKVRMMEKIAKRKREKKRMKNETEGR